MTVSRFFALWVLAVAAILVPPFGVPALFGVVAWIALRRKIDRDEARPIIEQAAIDARRAAIGKQMAR